MVPGFLHVQNLKQLLLCYGGAARSCTFSNSMLRCVGPAVTASWFTACCASRWKGTAARLALLVSLCGGGGGGQVRPSRQPAGGGCDVWGSGYGDTARLSCPSCAARCDGLEKAQGKRSDHEIIYFETFLSRMSFSPGRFGKLSWWWSRTTWRVGGLWHRDVEAGEPKPLSEVREKYRAKLSRLMPRRLPMVVEEKGG